MPPRGPPALMEELVEEVLLRFLPEDPGSLVRAALVSKRWCRLIAGRGFRRRFRELHRAPPMLGFICNAFSSSDDQDDDYRWNARLVPISSCLPRADHNGSRAVDYRHGRVICYHSIIDHYNVLDPFNVWNPITGEHLLLPYLPLERCTPAPFSFNATVLCAGGDDACGHLDGDCHRGHFLVVFVGTYVDGLFTYMYSSESCTWSEPSILAENPHGELDAVPAALVGNALYFVFMLSMNILKYDLGTRENSIIDMPPASYGRIILMTTEQGKLGFTIVDDFKLYLWSMEVAAAQGGAAVWTQDRVIELKNLLPADALLTPPDVVGCVHGHGVVLIGMGNGFFSIDAKLNQTTRVGEGIPCMNEDDVDYGYGHCFFIVVPYTNFYFPALGAVSIAEEPSEGASSAR